MKNGLEIDSSGTKRYYLNGKLHREDGPAIENSDGTKAWYINDQLHRVDGPAIEYADGSKAWFLNGEPIKVKDNDNKSFLRLMKSKAFGNRKLSNIVRS
jgi:hypothetical protein